MPLGEASTVAALTVGVVGLIMLFSTSLPFNKISAALVAAMTASLALGALLLGKFFSFVPLSGTAWVIFASFAAAAIPLYIGFHVAVKFVGERLSATITKRKKRA